MYIQCACQKTLLFSQKSTKLYNSLLLPGLPRERTECVKISLFGTHIYPMVVTEPFNPWECTKCRKQRVTCGLLTALKLPFFAGRFELNKKSHSCPAEVSLSMTLSMLPNCSLKATRLKCELSEFLKGH